MNAKDPGSLAARAAVLFEQDDWKYVQTNDPKDLFKSAFADCGTALQIAPNEPLALMIRGLIYWRARETDKAGEDFKAAASASGRARMLLRKYLKN